MKRPKLLLQQRVCNPQLLTQNSALHPVLQRVFSARKIDSMEQTQYALSGLIAPQRITNLEQAAACIIGHLEQHASILIFGDYDADGATSTALCVKALHMLGHENVSFVLPDRFKDGYGLSEAIAQRIAQLQPALVITVDSGIASVKGVAILKQANIDVIVTDHHLPADELPAADVIVNPNAFANSAGGNLAGVGVAFYLMLALRSRLRESGWFNRRAEPNFAELLDLVAIGTVADLVALDYNNRILVNEGLKRLRAGACSSGIRKLVELAGRSLAHLSAQDIGFSLAPRINAAGRLDDMSIGVQTLLAEEESSAARLASELEDMNLYRRELQAQMSQQAIAMLPQFELAQQQYSHVLYQPDWHEGIVGIIASRIKDISNRPAISFAGAENGILKGSGRSVSGIHLRDMLDLVDKAEPGLILRFGGHAMAAGLSIEQRQLERFKAKFEQVLQQQVDPACFENIVLSDGQIEAQEMTLELAKLLRNAGPWGQKFPAPSFDGEFKVLDQRVLAKRYLKFVLSSKNQHQPVDAIFFNPTEEQLTTNFQTLQIHYELALNHYRGQDGLQLLILNIF